MRKISAVLCLLIAGFAFTARGEEQKPGVVCHVKVLSDKVDDVSSLEAWKAAFIKDGMTDQEKAIAIWKSVASFQYQDAPAPREFLQHEDNVYEPIKMFNVYGYGICCYASAHVEALGRYVGLQARGWGINSHSVCELGYDNGWHLFDSSLIGYFPKADGKVASVDEITHGIQDWYKANPALYDGKHGIDAKLREFQKGDGNTAWKTKGPEVLSRCLTYDPRGWWPAGTHGWYSTMQEYDGSGGGAEGKSFVYEYGALLGYEVNIQLRPGEKLTRNWFNKGLHVEMDSGDNKPGSLTEQTGKGFQRHTPNFGDLAPGRIGNGTLEYIVPLATGEFKAGALSVENLASQSEDNAAPAMHVKDAANPGVLVLRMPCSYVYLSGKVNLKAIVGEGGEIKIDFSDNNGLDWKELKKLTATGVEELDLKPNVYRRYDYRLKFTLKGKGTGLDELKIVHDIQHSQRPLPALTQGDNKINFSAGAQESTITVAANTKSDHAGKQVLWTDFHGTINGFDKNIGKILGPSADATFPIATPGDMTRLRFAVHYQSWSAPADSWEFHVSFDGGKTFKKVGDGEAVVRGTCKYFVISDVPTGTRSAQVKFVGQMKGANLLWSFRIDADYKVPNSGFRPVKITYQWEENGAAKEDVHVAKSGNETYTINCATKPKMKSIVLELAQ